MIVVQRSKKSCCGDGWGKKERKGDFAILSLYDYRHKDFIEHN